MLALKNLTRFRLSISDICGSLKKKVIAILDQVFPEYTGVFSDVFGKTSKQLLEQFSTPDEFMDISTTKLTNLLLKVSRGRNGREKAELIKTAAQSSIGISYALDAFSFELKQLLAQIEFMENQLSDVDAEMENFFLSPNTQLLPLSAESVRCSEVLLSAKSETLIVLKTPLNS